MLKIIRYILLLAIVVLAMVGIATANLAYTPFVYLLASFYIVSLIIQATKEKKTSLIVVYSVACVIVFVLFIIAL